MKKIALCFLCLCFIAATGFAENLTLDNQSTYPMKHQNSKMAVQWASSAKEIEEGNQALMHGSKLNPSTLQAITKPGKIKLSIPKNAEYFRVLTWSKGDGDPDFNTNWVNIVPNKTYTLEEDHLVPSVLMSGSGC